MKVLLTTVLTVIMSSFAFANDISGTILSEDCNNDGTSGICSVKLKNEQGTEVTVKVYDSWAHPFNYKKGDKVSLMERSTVSEEDPTPIYITPVG